MPWRNKWRLATPYAALHSASSQRHFDRRLHAHGGEYRAYRVASILPHKTLDAEEDLRFCAGETIGTPHMQVGDHSGLVGVLVIAKTPRREVKSVLMFSDRVFRTIFRVPKQGKAGLAVSKLLAKMTVCRRFGTARRVAQ